MVVTRDGGIPLVGHAYPGNRPDVAVVTAVIDALVARYSAANFAHLGEVGLHIVGSLHPPPAAGTEPEPAALITELMPTQQRLSDPFGLQRYTPHPMTQLGNTPRHC